MPEDDVSEPEGSLRPSRATAANLEYVRRVYERAMDWYKVAETKAQIILTVNGLLVTIFFGITAQSLTADNLRTKISGAEAWFFLFVSTCAVLGSVTCAVACLWSRHGANSQATFVQLGVDPEDPHTYKPEVLWYFGDIANLPISPAMDLISQADIEFEIKALSYNVVHLSRVVLRKHRYLNAGWVLTAVAISSLILGGMSVFIRAQT